MLNARRGGAEVYWTVPICVSLSTTAMVVFTVIVNNMWYDIYCTRVDYIVFKIW